MGAQMTKKTATGVTTKTKMQMMKTKVGPGLMKMKMMKKGGVGTVTWAITPMMMLGPPGQVKTTATQAGTKMTTAMIPRRKVVTGVGMTKTTAGTQRTTIGTQRITAGIQRITAGIQRTKTMINGTQKTIQTGGECADNSLICDIYSRNIQFRHNSVSFSNTALIYLTFFYF